MPKPKSISQKEKNIKEFVKLTWEVVRRNPEYRQDYVGFLQNYGLTSDDVKPKQREDGSNIIPGHPARTRWSRLDYEKGRYVWENDEEPDPERYNLPYMMQRWGFACDPDDPIPQGSYWRGAFISKEWLHKRREGIFSDSPLMNEKILMKKLPGVLEVNRWPDYWLTRECIQKKQDADRMLEEGWRPKSELELQEYKEAIRSQWEIEDPPRLTVTINLQAPSWLIDYAFEFLRAVCKADLGIKEKKIEWQHIEKCLKVYDLHQQGYSAEDIADHVELTHYKKEEAMRNGLDEYLKDWGIPQVERCLNDVEEMLKKGSII